MDNLRITHVNITPSEVIYCEYSDGSAVLYYQLEDGQVVKVHRLRKEYLTNSWVELLDKYRKHPMNWQVKALERWKEMRKSVPIKSYV